MYTLSLSASEYGAYYAAYIGLVPNISLLSALEHSGDAWVRQLELVPEDKFDYAYAPGKWTVKESLQHVLDTERIFQARALRIARGDVAPLPGYDQDDFAAVAKVGHRKFSVMIDEFRLIRRSSKMMFNSFTAEDLQHLGQMSGAPATTRAIGFILSGHVYHHINLNRDRYGLPEVL